MYLNIHFRKTKEVVEFESDSTEKILTTLKGIDFVDPFYLIMYKEEVFMTLDYDGEFCLLEFINRTNEVFQDMKINRENSSSVRQILKHFVTENDSFITAKSFRDHKDEQVRIEKEKYNNWKVKYDKQRKNRRFYYLKPLAIAILITLTIVVVAYYSLTGEYKFIGQNTEFVRAEIVKIEIVRFGGRYYYQRIFYNYKFNSMNYQDSAIIDKRIGKRKIGDIIQIKFSVSYPERSKVLGHY